jgi:outer membrane murein-binding lipoprotein Lpp
MRSLVAPVLAIALLFGCSKVEEKKQAIKELAAAADQFAKSAEQAGKAMESASKTMEGSTSGAGQAPTADFRALKALLPESLPGMKRTEAKGEKVAFGGFGGSFAEGTYHDDKDGDVSIKISDMGGIGAMASAAWTLVEIDSEQDNRYEKTTKISGFKAHETYDKSSKSGQIDIAVPDSIIIEVRGNNVSMDVIKGAVAKMDLAKLAAMKGPAVAKK